MQKETNKEDTFGKRLETLRLESGLSMSELAKLVGVSHVQISNYEKDVQNPTAAIVAKLSTHLKTSTDFMLYGNPDEELTSYFKKVKQLPGAEQRKILEYLKERFQLENWKRLKEKPFSDLIKEVL